MNSESMEYLMRPPTVPFVDCVAVQQNQLRGYSDARLVWRHHKLIVRLSSNQTGFTLPTLEKTDRLIDCLQRSPVTLVKLDLNLGKDRLQAWADACQQANKVAFLRLPAGAGLPQKRSQVGWKLKRICDWVAAAVLLVLLSPLLMVLALLIRWDSPGPIFFQQWRVGERGKLFRMIKFRTLLVGAEQGPAQWRMNQARLSQLKQDSRMTTVGCWMRRSGLDRLPLLFNVWRGEMSLVGPRALALEDAVRLSPKLRGRLNALPGITGAWQMETRSHLLDLNLVNRDDLKYLYTWSVRQDCKFLLLSLFRVLAGFGAH